MDSSFSLGSAHNKGILSLLSAIEQTGDTMDTDGEDAEGELRQAGFPPSFQGLDLAFPPPAAPCPVCLSSPGPRGPLPAHLARSLEAVLGRTPPRPDTGLCPPCRALLQQVADLETELAECKRSLTSRYRAAHPPPTHRTPRRVRPAGSLPSVSDLGEPGDFSEPVIDAKMPLQFLAGERESRLDILAQEAELEATDLLGGSSSDEASPAEGGRECQLCHKLLKTAAMYQRHMKSHVKEKIYNCEECGKAFATKHNMMAHVKTHFETKTFSCPHCEREFKGKKSLIEHISSKHNNEKRFVCSQCPDTFVSRHLKNVHERSHNGERGFICDQCGESFATVQGLGHHKSKHTGDYQYRCRACDKGFNNYKLLEEHSHIHTGSKPYQCTKCDKGFANRGSLWIHQKQHEDSKPYACPECGKGFSHSSHLAVHRRIHTGEKPYRCRLCGEGFISSNHLKRHMKSHAGQLPFACGTCRATFGQRRELVRHSNAAHQGQLVEAAAGPAGEEPEGQEYSLMPVSLMDDAGLGEVGELEGQGGRLMDLLGQTIVLIQVPEARPRDKPAVQF